MKHYIIVKFKDPEMKNRFYNPVKELFEKCLELDGVRSLSVLKSNSDRPNRYDLMIEIRMDREALAAYDSCRYHREWKDIYGSYIESKAIFDCDE